jgi:hypothetical protein
MKCSKKPSSERMDTDLNADVGLLVGAFRCKYIRFMVAAPEGSDGEPPNSKRARTAVDVLMAAATCRDKLPKPKAGKNKKEVLFNDV